MKFNIITALSALSLVYGSSNSPNSGSGMESSIQVSPNNTILQNLYALAMNQTSSQNTSLSYISLLLGLNTSCTANLTEMLNSTSGNYTFFAPSDQAFRAIPGFPDFGANFCQRCNGSYNANANSSGSGSGFGRVISRIFQNDQGIQQQQPQCPVGCNDTSLAINATSSQLMPCLPLILQYHLLNESLTFNSTSFGFLNSSNYNLTVLPTMLNSSCLVNLVNATNGATNFTNDTSSGVLHNNQVLVFNISSSMNDNSSLSESQQSVGSSQFNVTILHGINAPANVTKFDIPSSNGILHVVDSLLIPPANMTATINSTYSNSSSSVDGMLNSGFSSFLNQTDLEMYANMSGITVFLPDTNSTNSIETSDNNSLSSFNITNYIFPSLLYNNRSFEIIGNLSDGVFFQQNLTNLNGENVTILFGRNNAMLFNGSRVTQSNILMKNGVLHLFNASQSVFGTGEGQNEEDQNGGQNGNGEDQNASAGVITAGLGRIFRQVI
jgi:uncharacterized surface protein with fasciclin (FAS1) repeats